MSSLRAPYVFGLFYFIFLLIFDNSIGVHYFDFALRKAPFQRKTLLIKDIFIPRTHIQDI